MKNPLESKVSSPPQRQMSEKNLCDAIDDEADDNGIGGIVDVNHYCEPQGDEYAVPEKTSNPITKKQITNGIDKELGKHTNISMPEDEGEI